MRSIGLTKTSAKTTVKPVVKKAAPVESRRRIDRRIRQIAEHYGFDAQRMRMVEKSSRLTSAIVQFDDKRPEAWTRFVNETVDVAIILGQLIHHIDKRDPEIFTRLAREKLEAQVARMEASHD